MWGGEHLGRKVLMIQFWWCARRNRVVIEEAQVRTVPVVEYLLPIEPLHSSAHYSNLDDRHMGSNSP